jgi:hypothetical protein
MDAAILQRPDEVALRRDLEGGRFLLGVMSGRWRLLGTDFPFVLIAVRAADGDEFVLRFECTNYPQTPATAALWDAALDRPLDPQNWPKGTSRIPLAFNPGWKAGTCLYLPCDRQSIEGHEVWLTQHPALLWEPAKGISKYLSIVHQLLNSGEYGGRHVPL